MEKKLIFIISTPRSGSTMLQRMIGSLSDVCTIPEPHILTPLAHLGYFHQIEKAPYNHRVASMAIRDVVEELPAQEDDYVEACRMYASHIYECILKKQQKKKFVDKTPDYARRALPFITRLYPKAKYIVLTRHPLAFLSSISTTFYKGNCFKAIYNRNTIEKFLPPIALFLREHKHNLIHVKYENLVLNPEKEMKNICQYIGVKYEKDCLNYGLHNHIEKTFGDPNINNNIKPISSSINKWKQHILKSKIRAKFAKNIISNIDIDDLKVIGYDKKEILAEIINPQSQNDREKRYNGNNWVLRDFFWYLFFELSSFARKNMCIRQIFLKIDNFLDLSGD